MGNSRHGGFTLLELMMVVTIVGILSAISLMVYSHYTTRAKVVEGLVMVGKLQYALAEFRHSQNRWPNDNSEAGLVAPAGFSSQYLKSITVQPGGLIVLDYTPEAGDGTIVYQATASDQGIQWDCRAGTMAAVYRPQVCR